MTVQLAVKSNIPRSFGKERARAEMAFHFSEKTPSVLPQDEIRGGARDDSRDSLLFLNFRSYYSALMIQASLWCNIQFGKSFL
jgi:hypothetical protein